MTTIAAAHDPGAGVTWMQADTQLTAGNIISRSPGKIVRRGAALLGLAGWGCYAPWLRVAPPPEDGEGDSYPERLWSDFATWAREQGHGTAEGGRWHIPGFELLVGTPWALWEVDGDGVVQVAPPWGAAVGTGGPMALGAMVTRDDDPAVERVLEAVRTGCLLDCYSSEPGEMMTTCDDPDADPSGREPDV